jgi:hypothetical protein
MSKFGVPTDEQLAKINKLAKRTLTAEEVFAFSGKAAGDLMIPGRYMRLSKEILQVMADDARKGVSFMYNHSWSQWNSKGVPYGKVFEGYVQSGGEKNETVELYLTKYIVRDDEVIDGISANGLIKKIETGVLSDTSIGWGTDIMVCSICGMNYYSRDCSHWRGNTYELADGTKEVCTVTAMPPSVIIPYNNNALYEESIVWDGAYPGAVVAQSKHGDIIELPTGKFMVVQEKEELPENTLFHGYYHNGDIVTMVKKSDRKKVYTGGTVDSESVAKISEGFVLPPETATKLENIVKTLSLKGGEKPMEKPMNEKLTKLLETLGITYKEGESKPEELLNQLAEKYDAHIQTIKDSAAPLAHTEPQEGLFMTAEQVKEKLGKDLAADEVLSLAKEGQDYLKKITDEALAMGVRAMGNDFKKETWEKTFSTMSSKDILDITATWEAQAKANIPAGRQTDPAAGMQQAKSLPDEAFKVGK